ncbi:protein DpdG [Pseudonocardia adelaidensis]|uniref:Uncharacterized protein n=1 Tax=Pseudonocardia adelaidensis TaxID=648754 RepID=A0ABP9NXB4_9PSEU
MDYLKQHLLASVPALFVVTRYLADQREGFPEAGLRRALQPRAMFNEATEPEESTGAHGALLASLEVGADIGLLAAEGARGPHRVWTLHGDHRDNVAACTSGGSGPFRSLVLRLLGGRARAAADEGQQPADLARALTWLLLTQNPLTPLAAMWSDGPEAAFDNAHLDKAVDNPEQWRAFRRWARSLGVATDAQAVPAARKARMIVDPTPAIRSVLPLLPVRASAAQWLGRLRFVLPVLGDPALAKSVNADAAAVPATVAFALQKLERTRHLELITSDDARDGIVLQLGTESPRTVTEVRVEAVA